VTLPLFVSRLLLVSLFFPWADLSKSRTKIHPGLYSSPLIHLKAELQSNSDTKLNPQVVLMAVSTPFWVLRCLGTTALDESKTGYLYRIHHRLKERLEGERIELMSGVLRLACKSSGG
jgi:hypothetical protein